MTYDTVLIRIKKYLQRRYNYRISFGLKTGKPLEADRKDLYINVSGIDEEVLELALQQMYEEGYIVGDDGQTVCFSVPFVFG